jgi:hypothetical protein
MVETPAGLEKGILEVRKTGTEERYERKKR